jgi:hypothetical protein
MQPGQRRTIEYATGLGVVVIVVWVASYQRYAAIVSPPSPPPPPASSRSQAMLRRAWACWWQAQTVVNNEIAALDAWDPAARPPGGDEVFRRQLMSRDTAGHLARARSLAQQALAFAETRTQDYEATLLLVRIECDADRPAEELSLARRLIEIDPTQPRAQSALRDALEHMGVSRKGTE